MSVKITYFVHGTTTDNEADLATGWLPGKLSEIGRQQARQRESCSMLLSSSGSFFYNDAMTAIEAWEDPQTNVRFYITHSDEHFTTGVTVMPPHTELPQHNRPLAVENLAQVAGSCLIKLVGEDGVLTEHVLETGDNLSIPQGQFHIHANPHDEPSVTLFKL
jgi:quercetin dioxygenase-like cupin family protein